jgi:hypothetical protein
MLDLLKKMNHKGQSPLLVLQAPDDFATRMQVALGTDVAVLTDAQALEKSVDFALAFATRQVEVDAFAHLLAERTEGDAIVWMAYPKGSSKRYRCDFNRDTGWNVLGLLGFEPVRQVAIDEDWSALRFRRVGFIKTMTRSFAMTDEGKQKAEKKA